MVQGLCPSVVPTSQGSKAVFCCDGRGSLRMEEVRVSVKTSFLLWRKPAGGVGRFNGEGRGSSRCGRALPRAASSQGTETGGGGQLFPSQTDVSHYFFPKPHGNFDSCKFLPSDIYGHDSYQGSLMPPAQTHQPTKDAGLLFPTKSFPRDL